MAQARYQFNLGGLNRLRGGAGSTWARMLRPVAMAGIPYSALARGLAAITVPRLLKTEGVIRDEDLRSAIGALSLVSGGLDHLADEMYLTLDQTREIVTTFAGGTTIQNDRFVSNVTIPGGGLLTGANVDIPNLPRDNMGNYSLNAAHWKQWLDGVRDDTDNYRQGDNTPHGVPAGCPLRPVPGEMHPYAFAGLLDINLHDATEVPDLPRNPNLTALEVLIDTGLTQPSGAARAAEIMSMLAQGVTSITCGGALTPAKLRKIIRDVQRETQIDTIDFNKDAVVKGWDFISLHWIHNGQAPAISSQNFQDLFRALETEMQTISLRLSLVCKQTEYKFLTGLTIVVQSIRGFSDFPWEELNQLIKKQTGKDEMFVVLAYAQYVNGGEPPTGAARQGEQPAGAALPPARGGHWTGWTYNARTQNQGNFRNPCFVNLLYCSWRLQILAGGNLSMNQYQGLESMTVPTKPTIDAWIQEYISSRASATNLFPKEGDRKPDSEALHTLKTGAYNFSS